MSLGFGFEFRGYPPQPVVTVIEPGGAADHGGVCIGDQIVSVDGISVAGTDVDVRRLLTGTNAQVTLVLQRAESRNTSGGLLPMLGLSSMSQRQPPRTITLTRRGQRPPGSGQQARGRDEDNLPSDAKAARDRGRSLFGEGKWLEAAEAFSEAINAAPSAHLLLTNRALCNQKLERWGEVERDASEAMSLCGTSVKAHYLLGKALLENGKLKEARESLLKSLSLSSSPEFRSYRLSIEEMLYMTRRKLWEADEEVVQANDDNTHMELNALAQTCFDAFNANAMSDGPGDEEAKASALMDERIAAVARMCSRARVRRCIDDVPAAIICKLTGKIMIDPVVTPTGHSYERRELEKQLEQNGGRDPFKADKRYTKEDLESNLTLKRYIDEYLQEHPWAYGLV